MSIAENVCRVRAEIAEAALASGRDPSEIILVAATKMNRADRVQEAIAAGVDACGENRVQELQEKLPQGAYSGVPVHMIGHLQKNKVKYLIGNVSLIQSVDTVELLQEIDRCAKKHGLLQDVLLEVNIGGEGSKSGFAPAMLPQMLLAASALSSVRVRGLMAIPPICVSAVENRPYFEQMRELFIDNSTKKYDNISMDFLSMGMSNDYAEAVSCGANMVRVGTAIFGARVYPEKNPMSESPEAGK